MSKWLDFSNNANKFKQSYFNGFIDINYGNICLRNSQYLNMYDSSNNLNFSVNSKNINVYDGVSQYYNVNTSQLIYICDLSASAQSQINSLVNSTKYIQSDSSNSNTVLNLNSSGTANLYGNLNVAKYMSIGKTVADPSYVLDVSGLIRCTNIYFNTDVSSQTQTYGINIAPLLNVNGKLIVNSDTSLNAYLYVNNDASLNSNLYVGGNSLLQGNVIMGSRLGVGVSNPVCMLDVGVGSVISSNGTSNNYFNSTTTITNSGTGISSNYSILSRGSILSAGSIVATNSITFSDYRIKTNIKDINSTSAIEILRKIQPKQFTYKDQLYHGSLPNYGFIAQDVENVIKYAVGKITKYIPNIFELCQVKNGNIIMLQNTTTKQFTIDENKDNKTVVKLYDENNCEIITSICKIIDDKSFQISTKLDIKTVFVYGQEITDFRVVDKDIIFTIATAALKEFDKELQENKEEMKTMKQTIQDLNDIVSVQQKQIDTILSHVGCTVRI